MADQSVPTIPIVETHLIHDSHDETLRYTDSMVVEGADAQPPVTPMEPQAGS